MAKTKPGHRGEFAAPKGRIVAELDGEPRPKGRAPGNDTGTPPVWSNPTPCPNPNPDPQPYASPGPGTPLVWSYVRGKWVDVSKGGSHRGEKLSEAEREASLTATRTPEPNPNPNPNRNPSSNPTLTLTRTPTLTLLYSQP